MQTTFKLYKSLIMETVKNETHISAHVARATDKAAAELAYHEEAGDETFHVRKLERSLYASIDKIKAEIIGYLDTNASSVNITSAINEDEITFTLILSDRFNAAYLTPLADLVSKFIEDNMLFLWWTPINANTATNYSNHVELDRQAVLKCFIKNAPSQSSSSYANVIGSSDGTSGSDTYATAITTDTTKSLYVDDSVVLAYTLTPTDAKDDIMATSSNTSIVKVLSCGSGKVRLSGVIAGTASIVLISQHNFAVTQTCAVTVSETSKYDVDRDGDVDENDAAAVQDAMINTNSAYKEHADVNGDGKIDISDKNEVETYISEHDE